MLDEKQALPPHPMVLSAIERRQPVPQRAMLSVRMTPALEKLLNRRLTAAIPAGESGPAPNQGGKPLLERCDTLSARER